MDGNVRDRAHHQGVESVYSARSLSLSTNVSNNARKGSHRRCWEPYGRNNGSIRPISWQISWYVFLHFHRKEKNASNFAVERVRRTALALAQQVDSIPKPDLLTVELAALLHDVLDKKYVSPAEAANPYAFFLPFFEAMASNHGVDLIRDGRAYQITNIIDNVSWSTEKKRREIGLLGEWHTNCVELHCVQDADRLDAIGAFGEYELDVELDYH